MCLNAVTGAYEDDKRETLNSLIRVKTPFPKRENCEEIAVRTVSCACFPLKLLEGLGMITCGALLWPIPCTVCKIRTEHGGTNVSVEGISLGTRTPHIPCHFEDNYTSGQMTKISEGTAISFNCCQRPVGTQEHIYATSSLTGYECLTSGIEKIVNAVFSVLCCPVATVSLACAKTNSESHS